MSSELPKLFVNRFIARKDVKAIQYNNGDWSPHTTTGKHDGERIPWRGRDLEAHLSCEKTYGHYLLNTDSTCKLFAFDIDLEKVGFLPDVNESSLEDPFQAFDPESDLRGAWLNRQHHGRPWMKLQFKQMAHMLARAITEELDLPCAVAYSGGKGVHVYGFMGTVSASEARLAAMMVLDSLDCFKLTKGVNFYKHTNEDPFEGFPNLSIEVFPKQSSLDGKDLGNLMRLPLGRNLKSKDPTFFIDMTSPLGDMSPVDAEWALTTDSPWKKPGE